jgi:predicted nucleic acid-binding protein
MLRPHPSASSRSVGAVADTPPETPRRSWAASGTVIAVVDTGPLYAAVDADDADHHRCAQALTAAGQRLVIPAMVVAETSYLVGSRLGPAVEGAFLRSLVDVAVEAPLSEDWSRIAELVEQYADFPLGGTDASVIALAERLGTDAVITLDRRHFAVVQPRHCSKLRLLP